MKEAGDWSWNTTLHARLVLGSKAEVEVVRRIFRLYLAKGGSQRRIADKLNAEHAPFPTEAKWSQVRVRRILTNPIYFGRLVQSRHLSQLRALHRLRPREEWITVEDGAPAIVTKATFEKARRKYERLAHIPTNDELLQDVRGIVEKHGTLDISIIQREGRWTYPLYRRRLGGVYALRARFGLSTPRPSEEFEERLRLAHAARFKSGQILTDEAILATLRRLLAEHGRLTSRMIREAAEAPNVSTISRRFGGLENAYLRAGYIATGSQATVLRAMREKRCSGPNPLILDPTGVMVPIPMQLSLFAE